MSDPIAIPMVILAGPPGAGKSALGQQACERLGLSFADLSPPPLGEVDPRDAGPGRSAWEAIVGQRSPDVVALSWRLQQDKAVLGQARRAGELLLLWAHPLEMLARSQRSDFALTPARRIRTHGGFGRRGTGCLEFRALSRASHAHLLLCGVALDAAAFELAETIKAIREDAALPPAQREGLDHWVRGWQDDCSADPRAASKLVDAMARFTLEMKRQGKSGRVLAGMYADLDAAGMLVMNYLAPKAKDVLSHFVGPPCEYEFECKFSDLEYAMARYRRTLTAFGDFLVHEGLVAGAPGPPNRSLRA